MKQTAYFGHHSVLCPSGGMRDVWHDYTSGRVPLKKLSLSGRHIELNELVGVIPQACGMPDPFTAPYAERLRQGLKTVVEDLARQGVCGPIDYLLLGRGRMRMPRFDAGEPELRKEWPPENMLDWLLRVLGANGISIATGRAVSLETSCVTGIALARAALDRLQTGVAKRILLINFDVMSMASLLSLGALGVLSHQERPRVFDDQRDGFARSEAISAVVFSSQEELPGAQTVLRSAALNSDGGGLTEMDESGARVHSCVIRALKDAGVKRPSFIKAHGTGTRMGDSIEQRVLERVFADSDESVAVTSFKPQFGHCLNGSGLFEMILAHKVLSSDCLMPALNSSGFHGVTSDNPKVRVVQKALIGSGLKTCLGLAMGFGGLNGAYSLERVS